MTLKEWAQTRWDPDWKLEDIYFKTHDIDTTELEAKDMMRRIDYLYEEWMAIQAELRVAFSALTRLLINSCT